MSAANTFKTRRYAPTVTHIVLGGDNMDLAPGALVCVLPKGAPTEQTFTIARRRVTALLERPLNARDGLTATRLLKSLEQILGAPKNAWNVVLGACCGRRSSSAWRIAKNRSSTKKPG